MNFPQSIRHCSVMLAAVCFAGLASLAAQSPTKQASSAPLAKSYPPELVQQGSALFRKDCSFCHGRDAGGGESGPDLTRSKLVTEDVDGDKIGPVVRNGRPDKGMPPFDRSEDQIAGLVAFIHTQQTRALTRTGGRK